MEHYKRKIKRSEYINYVFATYSNTVGLDNYTIGQPVDVQIDGQPFILTSTTENFTVIKPTLEEIVEIPVGDKRGVTDKNFQENTAFSGFSGPDMNIAICFKQKIKDLGIYNDTTNTYGGAIQQNIIGNIIDNINIGGG